MYKRRSHQGKCPRKSVNNPCEGRFDTNTGVPSLRYEGEVRSSYEWSYRGNAVETKFDQIDEFTLRYIKDKSSLFYVKYHDIYRS